MKIAGIVAEYNPFHNGHKYQIQATRQAGAEGSNERRLRAAWLSGCFLKI